MRQHTFRKDGLRDGRTTVDVQGNEKKSKWLLGKKWAITSSSPPSVNTNLNEKGPSTKSLAKSFGAMLPNDKRTEMTL